MKRGPLRRAVKLVRERLLDRLNLLYGHRFYRKSDRKKGDSDTTVAETLLARYRPSRVTDVGCGSGYFLAAFAARGIEVFGLERSDAGLTLSRYRGVPAARFDLRHDRLPEPARGDLCLCFEVAEHLPPAAADRLVEAVTAAAPVVIFTAAPPGQGGVGHFNEQPPEYWRQKFAARGFGLDERATEAVRDEWIARGVVSWLPANLMIFERAEFRWSDSRHSERSEESQPPGGGARRAERFVAPRHHSECLRIQPAAESFRAKRGIARTAESSGLNMRFLTAFGMTAVAELV